MADTQNVSNYGVPVQGVSIDNNRQLFDFKDAIRKFDIGESTWFGLIANMRKTPTASGTFKMLEERPQWQDRRFNIKGAVSAVDPDGGLTSLTVDCLKDITGRAVTSEVAPEFILPGHTLLVRDTAPVPVIFKVASVAVNTGSAQTVLTGTVHAVSGDYTAANWPATVEFADNAPCELIGSAFAEGTGPAEGWNDKLYDREGYTQIFKNATPVFSGSAQSEELRGHRDEFKQNLMKTAKSHRNDIARATLFGVGKPASTGDDTGYTWGAAAFAERFSTTFGVTMATAGYDRFLEIADAFAPEEEGGKMKVNVVAGRTVMNYLRRIQTDSFIKNTAGSGSYQWDIKTVPSKVGPWNVTVVDTDYVTFGFQYEPLFRGPNAGIALATSLEYVDYRPKVGNGISRDTFIEANVQAKGVDGRKDQYLTEAGLQINMPEKHCILAFS